MTLQHVLRAHAVLAALYALALLFVPATVLGLLSHQPLGDVAIAVARFFGAALVLIALVAWGTSRTTDGATRRFMTVALLVYMVIGTLLAVVGQVAGTWSVFGWSTVATYSLFAVGYAWFLFTRHRRTLHERERAACGRQSSHRRRARRSASPDCRLSFMSHRGLMMIRRISFVLAALLLALSLSSSSCDCGGAPNAGEGEGEGDAGEGEGEAGEGEGEGDAGEGEGEGEGDIGEGEGEGDAGEGEGEGEGGPADAVCHDGWCWENPRPAGFALNGVWPFDASTAWLGGLDTLILMRSPTDIDVFDAPLFNGFAPAQPQRMWASSTNDVWAAAGVMLHFENGTWSVESGTIGNNVVDVWGFAPDDVWAASTFNNVALHYDGIAWSSHPTGATLLQSIHGLATDDVWAAGGTVVSHWTGGPELVPETLAVSAFAGLSSIYAVAADDVWAAGDVGVMWRFTGPANGWQPVAAIPNVRLVAVVGFAPDDAWAVGGSTVAHWNGSTWGQAAVFSETAFTAMRAVSATNIWAVGSAGAIVRYDGDQWSRVGVPAASVTGSLVDVAASGAGAAGTLDAWAVSGGVGFGGEIAHRGADGVWRRELGAGVVAAPRGVATSAPDDVWVVAQNESHRFDGDAWTPHALPAGFTDARDVCTHGPDDAYAVEARSLLHFDGGQWSVAATHASTFADLDLFCLAGGDVYGGGDNLVIERDAASGVARQTGTEFFARGARLNVHATSPDDVWVVSYGDVFSQTAVVSAHWDGLRWSKVSVAGEPQLPANAIESIHGIAPDDVWLAGDDGLVAHWDGTAFTRVNVGSAVDFQCVFQLAPDDVMLIGRGGSDGRALETFRWNGATSTLQFLFDGNENDDIHDCYFASATDGWATERSNFFRWDGVAWDTEQFVSDPALHGVSSTEVYFTQRCCDNELLRWNGATIEPMPLPAALEFADVIDVWAAGPGDVWVIDEAGHVAHDRGDGAGFIIETTLSEGRALGGSGADDIWLFARPAAAAAATSNITRYNGAAFTPYVTLEDPLHFARAGAGNALIAVDRAGNVWDNVGGAWALRPLNGAQALTSALIVDDDEAFGIVNGGRLVRYNGVSWTLEDIPLGVVSTALGGTATDAFAVGFGGGVLHRQ